MLELSLEDKKDATLWSAQQPPGSSEAELMQETARPMDVGEIPKTPYNAPCTWPWQ